MAYGYCIEFIYVNILLEKHLLRPGPPRSVIKYEILKRYCSCFGKNCIKSHTLLLLYYKLSRFDTEWLYTRALRILLTRFGAD